MTISDVNSFINISSFEVLRVDFCTQDLLRNFSKDRPLIKGLVDKILVSYCW
jgi:hypothetical protein